MSLFKKMFRRVLFCMGLGLFPTVSSVIAADSPSEWLAGIFLARENCEPTSHLYYDPEAKRSYGSMLEKRGYVFQKNAEWTTTYVAPRSERFVGFPVLDFSIPNAEMSLYSLHIAQPPNVLAAAIQKATGRTVPILHGEPPGHTGRPYIVGETPGHSTFVCFSFEEGL
jgi:hypothetical protein